MIISSPFRDVYDSVASTGVDKTIVFHRIPRTFEYNKDGARRDVEDYVETYPLIHPLHHFSTGFRGYMYFLSFCGTLYPFAVWYQHNQREGTVKKQSYSAEEVRESLKKDRYAHAYDRVDRFFKVTFDTTQLHVEYASPILLFTYVKEGWTQYVPKLVMVNPSLESLGFHRQMDVFSIFQAIQTYLSCDLATAKPLPVTISDKDLAAKRGHDGKYSFRNPPQR